MHPLTLARRGSLAAGLAIAAAAVTPISADAHVTVHPNALPAGGFTVVTVRVPNERDKASTKKVVVQLPHGILFLSTSPEPGWTAKVTYRKLAKPVTVFGEKHTQEAGTVTWTATGPGIKPGEFLEFPLSLSVPSAAKQVLTFKALQTYSNGEVVRWIGPPSADTPAPQVMTIAKDKPMQDFPGGITAVRTSAGKRNASTPATPARPTFAALSRPAPVVIREHVVRDSWTLAALGLGAAGLLIGAAGLTVGLRRQHG